MDLVRTKTPNTPRSLTAVDKAAQRERIFAKLRDGRPVYTVAHEENLSAECVRQIVREILDGRAVEGGASTARLEIARLAPVVLTAATTAGQSKVTAIRLLVEALEGLDRAEAAARALQVDDEKIRETLIARLNRTAAALAAQMAAAEARAASAGQTVLAWG